MDRRKEQLPESLAQCRHKMALAQIHDRFGISSRPLGFNFKGLAQRHDTSSTPNLADPEKAETIFYLAYGSNLSAETFLGRRGIKPLSQLNVCVPSLKLTFDLSGVPYSEPCFANTARREVDNSHVDSVVKNASTLDREKIKDPDYHKDRWHKPLVGVLYGLTPSDYAHVIATEGGGISYHDIIVPCYPLDATAATVPMHPTGPAVQGHTLFAPPIPRREPDDPPGKHPVSGGRIQRPDPAYAQPSERYLKLITDGALEHGLPTEYREYLAKIRPYRRTTQKQRLGQFIFTSIWTPIVMFLFELLKLTENKEGRAPQWVAQLLSAVFMAVWVSYDELFQPLFGPGERTIGD